MELAEQSPTSSFADVNKLSCAIHSIQKSPQEGKTEFVDRHAGQTGDDVAVAGELDGDRRERAVLLLDCSHLAG